MTKFANFEVTFELKELKIHVKGDREIAPSIADNVGKHFGKVLSPAGLIEAPTDGHNGHKVIEGTATPAPRPRRRSGTKSASSNGGTTTTVNWNHDPAKWGSPIQTWKQWQKIMWLLYVVEEETSKHLTTTEMTDIFKDKFKSAGLLVKGNIPRDLGNQSDYFGEVDGRWYLKQAGKQDAARLVSEARGGQQTA